MQTEEKNIDINNICPLTPKYNTMPALGFKNTGSICYFNSLIQCILSSSHFLKFIVNHENKYNLFREFLKFVNEEDKWDVLFTTRLLILCKMINPNQSSSEYFVYLLDLLKLEPLFESTYKDIYECKECHKKIYKKDISYCPLVNNDFSEFFEFSEEIENFNCEECKEKRTIIHTKKIESLSDIVVISFNKYFEKKMIAYPSEFKIYNENGEQSYQLIGTVEHIGTLSGGHYICRIKRNDTIYIADDINVQTVESLDMKPVMETYMVFYEKN